MVHYSEEMVVERRLSNRRGNSRDLRFMRAAIAEAKAAAKEGNAPIGAVIVRKGRIVERGHNKVFTSHDVTAHAEVVVIRKMTKRHSSFDLKGYTLYTTFIPCATCTVTTLRTNIPAVVYGAEAKDAPQFSSGIHQKINHETITLAKSKINFTGGILREECAQLLRNVRPD